MRSQEAAAGAGETAQGSTALTPLPEEPGSTLNTRMVFLNCL